MQRYNVTADHANDSDNLIVIDSIRGFIPNSIFAPNQADANAQCLQIKAAWYRWAFRMDPPNPGDDLAYDRLFVNATPSN